MDYQAQFEHLLGRGRPLRLELGAGDYSIQPGVSNNVLMIYQTADPRLLSRVKVSVTSGIRGDLLKISSVKDFKATIRVPKVVGLSAKLRAGTLDIKDVEGDKSFDVGSGTLKVDMVRQDHYANIDASVKVGRVDGGSLGRFYSLGGSELRKQGPGKYSLHAHVDVGNVLLYSGAPVQKASLW